MVVPILVAAGVRLVGGHLLRQGVKMGAKTIAKRQVKRLLRGKFGIPSIGVAKKKPVKRRQRGMYLRKGRLFMGFTQKEVKAAMRRKFSVRGKK